MPSPQNTAESQSNTPKLTKKQRKGLAFRQKLQGKSNRKLAKLGDLDGPGHPPLPEPDIVHDDVGLSPSENPIPNSDSSSSDRRGRSRVLNGKAQHQQLQERQERKQSHREGDVKTRLSGGGFGADTGTGATTTTETGSTSISGTERPSKKRKRPQVEQGGANLDLNAADSDAKPDAPPKPKKRKQKLPPEGDDGDIDEEQKDSKSSKQKTRYILFVGNLKYTTSKETIEAHFAHVDPPPTIRLLTPKPSTTSKSQATKSKGCAFLEFASHSSLQSALKLHHSTLDGRQINVELTAGGGGKSDKRLEKLKGRNAKLEVQRKKHSQKSTSGSSNTNPPDLDDSTPSAPTTAQRHSSTSGISDPTTSNKKRTWSIPGMGDESTDHRGGTKHKQRGGSKRHKDKILGTGVNAIPVG